MLEGLIWIVWFFIFLLYICLVNENSFFFFFVGLCGFMMVVMIVVLMSDFDFIFNSVFIFFIIDIYKRVWKNVGV